MRTLELFCGAGGGLLAHAKLLGHDPVGAAEIADFPRRVLHARIADGRLPKLTIHTDVRSVRGAAYRGLGCVSGGFPCQDLSAAGKGLGIDGERSGLIWEMLRVIEEARPAYVFAENSPRLRAKGLNRIVCALTALGYSRVAWGVLSAQDVGAPHIRQRMWLLAKRSPGPAAARLPVQMPRDGIYAAGQLREAAHWSPRARGGSMPTLTGTDAAKGGNRPDPTLWSLSDTLGITAKAAKHGIVLPTLAATDWKSPYGTQGLLEQLKKRSKPLRDVLPLLEGGRSINPRWAEWFMGWPPGWTDLRGRPDVRGWSALAEGDAWWTDDVEMGWGCLPRTLPTGTEVRDVGPRIKALGNGQVPLCAATAFTALQQVIG